MKEHDIKVNSLSAWVLAARPKTLTAASVPVLIGLASAFSDIGWERFLVLPAVLCLAFALVMQIAANFINDYYDYRRGNDNEERLGPERACAAGMVTEQAMRRAIGITIVAACLVGLPLVVYGGMEMVLVGVLCVAFCFLYTTHLSYMGLGDVLVIMFFGLVPVTIVYYLQAHTVTPAVVMLSIACGIVVDGLLLVNNYRDIYNDRKTGKNTLVVRIGARRSRLLYLFTGIAACVINALALLPLGRIAAAVAPCLYLPLHVATYVGMVKIERGRRLNEVLGYTARNIFVYGLLTAIGLIV